MARQEKKKRLSEIAFDEIKQSIINNTYKQGMMLSEKQLCATLNMSRTPVREAIHMLVTEDLLEVRDGVGTFVKERAKKDIEDAYEVRKSLEILAIQTSVNHFSEEELDELENTFRQMLERLRSHDTLSVEEYAEADWKLHDMIVQKSDNHYIRTVMDVLKSSLKRYQGLSVQLIANADNSMCEHLQIIDGIRRKDLQMLKEVLEKHLHY